VGTLAAVTILRISMEQNTSKQPVILSLSHLNRERVGNGVM
jgi:hypothetical protein